MKENQTNEIKAVVLHDSQPLSLAEIQARIYTVRNVQVMIDRDLALLYGVETRALKQAVRRNLDKFPDDFMLRLSENESNQLVSSGVSQFVIPPGYNIGGTGMFAFTEQTIVFFFGRPGSLRSPSGYPLYSLRSCRSYPCRDRASGRCRHIPFGRGGTGIRFRPHAAHPYIPLILF